MANSQAATHSSQMLRHAAKYTVDVHETRLELRQLQAWPTASLHLSHVSRKLASSSFYVL